MPATAAYNGLTPIKTVSGDPLGVVREFNMTANSAAAIGVGDMVNITAGECTRIAATPTTTANGNTPVGVCIGVRYTTPAALGAQEMHGHFLPAGAITAGYTNVWIKVIDNPDAVYRVQATAAVTRASIGKNAPLGNFTEPTATAPRSVVNLIAASIAATATLAVRIVDVEDPTASFPYVRVVFNQGVHAYRNATGQ